MSTKLEKIKEQIEYYLSDKNLEQDEYFRKEIETSSDGFINLNVFQKCNKIKKLGVTNEEIMNAIKASTEIEANAANNGLRRKNNRSLPEFKESNKKLKTENNNNEHKPEEEKKKEEPKEEKYEPLVFSMTAENDKFVDWKIIQSELEKKLSTKIHYTRYSKDEKGGHFVVNKFEIQDDKKKNIVIDGITIDEAHFKVTMIQDKELESFWRDHGGHYTLCVERKTNEKGKKNDRKSKKNDRKERERKKDDQQVEISLANRKYSDHSKVKNIFKQILNTSTDGEKIQEPNHTMLKDVLKFHENADKKLNKLSHFTVGIHPEYQSTRCFFVVKEDGTKEDFSVQKCLDTLTKKSKK